MHCARVICRVVRNRLFSSHTHTRITCFPPFLAMKIFCEHFVCVVHSWTVQATMDLKFCNATVDFNVPGKPTPLPVKQTATIWRQSRYLTTGILYKHAIEFTDPSGTLALSSVPLNTWVQVEKKLEYEEYPPDYEYEGCIGLNGSSIVFNDLQDDDSKLVTVFEHNVTLTPFGTNDERFPSIYCCNVCYSICLSFTAILLCAKMHMWFELRVSFAYDAHPYYAMTKTSQIRHIICVKQLDCTRKTESGLLQLLGGFQRARKPKPMANEAHSCLLDVVTQCAHGGERGRGDC